MNIQELIEQKKEKYLLLLANLISKKSINPPGD